MAHRSAFALGACFFLAAAAPLFGGCVDSQNPGISDAGAQTSTGAPVEISAGATVDLGPAACGDTTAKSQTFTVKNPGPGAAHFQLALAQTGDTFSVSPTSGDVGPGATATVTVTAAVVPNSAPAGRVDQATLTVTLASGQTAAATLKRTTSGATFTLTPASAAFGDVPAQSTSAPIALTLKNVGNAGADVALGTVTNAAFAVTGGGGDGGAATTVGAGASTTFSATFTPPSTGAATGTMPLTITGSTCGVTATSIPLAGNGTVGAVTVSSGSLDFGKVNCGATGAAQSVDVNNTGSAPITYGAAFVKSGSPFTVAPASGTIAVGAKATLTVTPKAIPQQSSTTANSFGDTLRITTNVAGDGNHDVALLQTAQGAVLGLTATTLQFDDVLVGQPATAPFAVTNSGNMDATVTMSTAAPFAVSPSTASVVTAGSQIAAFGQLTPAALGAVSDSITIATGQSDVLCSPPLDAITLSGNGINGVMSVTANALAFGPTACGATAPVQTFDVKNTGTAPFDWNADLGLGGSSPYTLSLGAGTLAANTSVTITVTPKAVPQTSALTNNLYGDTITVTPTGIAGGAATTVKLTQTAKGGIITVTGAVNYNSVALGSQSAGVVNVKNTGTMPVTITPSLTGTAPGQFFLATAGATAIAVSTQYNPGPTFKPTATGAQSATMTLAKGSTDVLCQPLPAPVSLSGTGTNGAMTVGSASVSFPAQKCGSAAGSATVNLKNTGNASLTWNASILGAVGFTVLPTSGTLAANANIDVTVKSPAFATNHGNVTDVTDTLRITTSAFGDGNHDVPLSATPSGAILALSTGPYAFGTVQASKSKGIPITVTNTGNVSPAVTFNLTAAEPTVTFSPQGSTVGGTPLSVTATFAPLSQFSLDDSVGISVPAGTALCKTLPGVVAVTGFGGAGVFGGVPTGMDFSLSCNTTPSTQNFPLTNATGTAPYDFSVTVPGGWLATPSSGSVPVNGNVPITITPPDPTTTPDDVSTGSAVVTTDIPGDSAHSFTVNGTTTGALLSVVNSDGLPRGAVAMNASFGIATDASTYIRNIGNQSYAVDAVVVPDPTNPSPAVTLGVAFDGPAVPNGNAQVTYSWDPSKTPSSLTTYKYTVYFPSADGLAGVCSAQKSQAVSVHKDTT